MNRITKWLDEQKLSTISITVLVVGIISVIVLMLKGMDISMGLINIFFVCFHWSVLQHDEINLLHQNNVLVFSYTNKFNIILQKMRQYKLDGIVTNYKILKS